MSVNYPSIDNYILCVQDHTIKPTASVPSALTNGTYRILDPASGASNLTRAGRVYFDVDTMTLYYYANGASASTSVKLDASHDAAFISYLTNLGYNSSFTVSGGKLTEAVIRFSSNDKKPVNNTAKLNDASFSGMSLTLHANNTQNSNAAGGIAKHGAIVTLSDTITSLTCQP